MMSMFYKSTPWQQFVSVHQQTEIVQNIVLLTHFKRISLVLLRVNNLSIFLLYKANCIYEQKVICKHLVIPSHMILVAKYSERQVFQGRCVQFIEFTKMFSCNNNKKEDWTIYYKISRNTNRLMHQMRQGASGQKWGDDSCYTLP